MLRIALAAVAALVLLLVGRFVYLSMTTQPPDSLGVSRGRLAPCPKTPNCVSSQAEGQSQRIDALVVPGSAEDAMGQVVRAIEVMPGARIVSSSADYLHAEFASRLFRFVDDLELVHDPDLPGFQVRSASRVGRSDLGANRKRVESLRAAVSR